MQDSQPPQHIVIVNTSSYTKGLSIAMDPLCQKGSFGSDLAMNKRVKSSYKYEYNNLSFSALSTPHNGNIEFNSSFRNSGTLVKEPPKKGILAQTFPLQMSLPVLHIDFLLEI